jgi:hypothetical protein
MGGEVCKQKTKERFPWYEIRCVKNDIISKESRGEDATFERELLKSWAKYPGYQAAGDALRSLGKSKSRRVKQAVNGNLPAGAK